jgi:2-iminobutanoate/2-iminopropanoate deaminase
VKQRRNPSTIHAPLAGYSHQIELRDAERLLVLSGQIGMAPDGQLPDDAVDQLRLALENVLRNLEAADMAVSDLVKLTLYLTEPVDADTRRLVLADRLGEHAPCMTLLYVGGLASPTIKVEVDAWASASEPP